MKRQESINKLIKDDMRSAGNHCGQSLSSCEICWTCVFFVVEGRRCVLSCGDVKKMGGMVNYKDYSNWEDYFKGDVNIEKPTWFRCMWWKDGKW